MGRTAKAAPKILAPRHTAAAALAAVALLLPCVGLAHLADPTLDRGFKAEQVYHYNGLDSVNLFNGNLTLDVPIGPVYRVGGPLSYQVRLAYNSKIWDFEYDFACTIHLAGLVLNVGWANLDLLQEFLYEGQTTDCYTVAIPNRKSNAGTGWTVGFGQLFGPSGDSPNGLHGPGAVNEAPGFLYVSPDGAEHLFYANLHGEESTDPDTAYTRDGSFLRLQRVTSAHVEIQMPDGVVHTFEEHVHLEGGEPGPETHWRLVQMRDAFGNWMRIDYPSDLTWVITDSAATSTQRRHEINFVEILFDDPDFGQNLRRERVVDSVVLSGPGGVESTYTFRYGAQHQPPALEVATTVKRACPNNWDGDGATTHEKLTDMLLLTELEQPDGTAFTFDYAADTSGGDAICSRLGGELERVTLPTGGGIAYEYAGFVSAREGCDDVNLKVRDGFPPQFVIVSNGNGVRARRQATDATVLDDPLAGDRIDYLRYFGGDWNLRFPSDETTCDLPKTGVTAVFEPPTAGRQRVTLNYFSIYQGQGEWDPTGGTDGTGGPEEGFAEVGWNRHDYGMPFTRESLDWGPYLPDVAHDPADPDRLISRDVYDCPTQAPDLEDPTDPNRTPFSGFDPAVCKLERRVFVRYERDPDSIGGFCGPRQTSTCTNLDRRLAEEVTYFMQDRVCNVAGVDDEPCYRELVRDHYDGLGNYRTVQTTGGFGPTRTVWTNFNQGITFTPADPTTSTPTSFSPPSTTGPWILGTFSDRNTRETGIDNTIFFESFRFDGSTGFLESHTRKRDPLKPLTTTYIPTASGEVGWEQHAGGDDGNLDGASDYVIHHTYQHGVLATSEYRDPAATGRTVLRFVDRTIDPATGLVTESRDPAGVATAFAHDAMWRLASITPGDAGEAKITYQYIPRNGGQAARVRVVAQRQDGGDGGSGSPYCAAYDTMPFDGLTQEEYEFDGLGRVCRSRTWLPDGEIAEVGTQYAPQGWVVRRTTPYDACAIPVPGDPCAVLASAPATETAHDVFGRTKSVTAPDGSFVAHDYEGERVETRTIHRVGAGAAATSERTLAYDHLGRLIRLAEPSGGSGAKTSWRYRYDEGGRLTAVTVGDDTSPRIAFDYDQAGLLLEERHPELAGVQIVHAGHDARGHAHFQSYGTGGSSFDVDFRYDAAERLVRVTQTSSQQPLVEHFYGRHGTGTSAGKLVASKRHNGYGGLDVVVNRTSTYGGPGGRLSHQRISTGGAGDVPRTAFDVHYTYDPLGNVAGIDYPDCSGTWCFQEAAATSPRRAASFGFTNGLLSDVWTVDPGASSFRLLATLAYHRDGLVAAITHSTGAADGVEDDTHAMGRPRSMAASGAGGVGLWSSGTYTYDGAGNIRAIGTDTFEYDLVHRLVAANLSFAETDHAETYTYDAFGNLLTRNGDAFFSDSATNRIGVWTYDLAGNVVRTGGDYSYAWDALGAMTRATQTSGTPDVAHLYDAGGERVAKLFHVDGAAVRELWTLRGHDERVLRDVEYLPKTDTSGGWRWRKDYLHRGSGLLASFGPFLDEAERRYHLDHLGTTRAISDASGNLVSRHKYLPFGEEIDPPTDIATERLRFTGHERDDLGPAGQLSDLDYMHARYYRPSGGRFLSVDPVVGTPDAPQSWNRYSYTHNRPMAALDPDGRIPLFLFPTAYEIAMGARAEALLDVGNEANYLRFSTGVIDLPGERNFGESSTVVLEDPTYEAGIIANPAFDPVSLVIDVATGAALARNAVVLGSLARSGAKTVANGPAAIRALKVAPTPDGNYNVQLLRSDGSITSAFISHEQSRQLDQAVVEMLEREIVQSVVQEAGVQLVQDQFDD